MLRIPSDLEVARQPVSKLLCKLCHLIVEVDGGCVLEHRILLIDGFHDFVMTVTHTHRHNAGKALHSTITFRLKLLR